MSVPGWRSYVWDLDVEGMTGLWWGRKGGRQRRRGRMENGCNWWSITESSDGVHRLEVRLILTPLMHLAEPVTGESEDLFQTWAVFIFPFSPLKERFLLKSLLSFTFGLWEEEAFLSNKKNKKNKTASEYDNTIKLGTMNHFRVDHKEQPLPRYHLIKISN